MFRSAFEPKKMMETPEILQILIQTGPRTQHNSRMNNNKTEGPPVGWMDNIKKEEKMGHI